jgi:hypothetical protein
MRFAIMNLMGGTCCRSGLGLLMRCPVQAATPC